MTTVQSTIWNRERLIKFLWLMSTPKALRIIANPSAIMLSSIRTATNRKFKPAGPNHPATSIKPTKANIINPTRRLAQRWFGMATGAGAGSGDGMLIIAVRRFDEGQAGRIQRFAH